jgi:hypothetical protein
MTGAARASDGDANGDDAAAAPELPAAPNESGVPGDRAAPKATPGPAPAHSTPEQSGGQRRRTSDDCFVECHWAQTAPHGAGAVVAEEGGLGDPGAAGVVLMLAAGGTWGRATEAGERRRLRLTWPEQRN